LRVRYRVLERRNPGPFESKTLRVRKVPRSPECRSHANPTRERVSVGPDPSGPVSAQSSPFCGNCFSDFQLDPYGASCCTAGISLTNAADPSFIATAPSPARLSVAWARWPWRHSAQGRNHSSVDGELRRALVCGMNAVKRGIRSESRWFFHRYFLSKVG
jgi:hypothetical protein